MKQQRTRAALEQFILAEIARSGRCPKHLRIIIEPRGDGRWAVVPIDKTEGTDPLCMKYIAAIEARFQIDFALDESI